MLDPASGNPFESQIADIADDFAFEVGPDLSSKKAHDFLGAEAQRAMAKQSRIKLVQVSRALKENIGGALALGGYPVVGHVLQKIGHQRIDLLGITVEKSRPIQRTKAV